MVERNLLVYNSVPKELQTAVADAMTGFLGTSDESTKLLRTMPAFAQMLAGQNFEYSEAMALADQEASQALNNFANTLGKSGAFDTVFVPLVGLVKQESAALNMTMDQRIAAARNEIAAQKAQTGAVADQAALRETQLRTAQDIQSIIGIFRGPVTAAMRGLATATGTATTALTNIADINQRGAAAGAGTMSLPTPAAAAAAPTTSAAVPARTPRRATSQSAQTPTASAPTPIVVAPVAVPLQIPQQTALATPPQFAQGGIATGPTSGYQAMLHGIEAVVPLGSGRSIPVKMPDMTVNFNEQIGIMSQQMSLLDDLVKETRNNNMLTERLLKIAQS